MSPMSLRPGWPRRKPMRLPAHDYSRCGAYFVTICTHEKECFLSDVVGCEVKLAEPGKITADCWQRLPERFPGLAVDAYVIMPNHLHGIIVLTGEHAEHMGHGSSRIFQAPSQTIGAIVRGFKGASTRRIKVHCGNSDTSIWQRNYWEHIIRDDADLERIQTYIENNPARWHMDKLNPDYS